MGVDIFNVTRFEDALPKSAKGEKLFQHIGVSFGEHCWAWTMPNGQIRIVIRSSIDGATGTSDGVGENSIRIYVEAYSPASKQWRVCGKGPDAYTTRIPGWEARLHDKILTVFRDLKGKLPLVTAILPEGSSDRVLFAKNPTNPSNKGRAFVAKPDGSFRHWINK